MATIYGILLFIFYALSQAQSSAHCELPLVPTTHETFIDYNGCSLFCDAEDAATPWTNRVTNKHISILFLSLLIPAFICNLVFTFNNISEHRENEETFATTPITYDALFVIDVAYLIVILCLLLPHFSFFDGGNTVSHTYICNSKDETISIGNPLYGDNGLCTLVGLLIFSGFKIILLYTGMLCVNIWYRLWRPMVDVGIKKRYLHGAPFATVFVFDILVIALGGIDANPSNGMCYIPMNDTALLLILDIIPNVLFIIISALSVAHAAKQLRQELNVIQQAELVSDDLVNLIHRMVGFLIMALLGSAFVVFTQIIWIMDGALWEQSTQEWIGCAQNKILQQQDGIWKYKYGDQCIEQLKKDGFSFPHEMFFIAFPIAALLSNIAIIVLTCHRRTSDRWRRGTMRAANGFKATISMVRKATVRESKSNEPPNMKLIGSVSPPSAIQLKAPETQYKNALSSEDKGTNLSVKVRHSPQNSQEVEQIGTVRFHENEDEEDGGNKMTFDGDNDNNETASGDELPGLQDADTMVRHSTDTAIRMADDMEEPTPATPTSQDQTVNTNTKANTTTMDKETEILIELDKQKSEHGRNKLEHISNASFDYHNLDTKGRSKTVGSAPLSNLLQEIHEADPSQITVTEEDVEKGKEVMGRIQTLEMDSNDTKRDSRSLRSKTLPVVVKRSSTQRHFIEYLDDALDDAKQRELQTQTSQSKTNKSVRFMPDSQASANGMEFERNMNQAAADVMLRSTTDSIAMKINSEVNQKKRTRTRELKKSKTSIDAAAIGLDIESLAAEVAGDKTPSPSPEIGDRRLSHKQEQEEYVKHVTERQNKGFFDRFGRRKKDIRQLKIANRKSPRHISWKSLKKASDFKTSAGTPLHAPSRLLKPLTMESQWSIDDSYFDEDAETMYSTPTTGTFTNDDTFSYPPDYEDPLDAMVQNKPTMQWQSLSNIFHFTLTDNDFKSMLHTTFTPHSTRNTKQMTFDAQDPYAQKAPQMIIKEDEEIMDADAAVAASCLSTPEAGSPYSQVGGSRGYTQSMGDLAGDQSVSAIGSDGRIVLSDIARFKDGKQARSQPLSNGILSEDEEIEYDVKYDDDELVIKTQKMKSHHKTETLHGRLLDAVPTADRKDLHITIHSDFSCQVAEKKKHHKAETAKLAFTLKPVHSMKILM